MKKPFTLVEVLVAMSVLSVFLLGLMQFYSSTETVLSSGVERTEMFERARIAMDMMANDLACVYYSQTDDEKETPFKVEGDGFSVVTVRPEKLNPSAKTTIVAVKYELNSDGKLMYSFDQNGDNFSLKGSSPSNENELVDGVTEFKVKPIYSKHCEALPGVVVLSMRLVDSKTLKRKQANSSLKIDDSKTREFRRMVVIDRGQPKPKLKNNSESGGSGS